MKAEAQIKALAEWSGWTKVFESAGILLPYRFQNLHTKKKLMDLPDWLNDLNAVHELEEKLGKKQQGYTLHLARVTQGQRGSGFTSNFILLNATAAQRCEALLRTLNLWKEDESE